MSKPKPAFSLSSLFQKEVSPTFKYILQERGESVKGKFVSLCVMHRVCDVFGAASRVFWMLCVHKSSLRQ
jgi:hypothetical protein